MPTKPMKKSTKRAESSVIDTLQEALKETYALYLLTHNYHWNVEGPKFFSLHTLFEQQYTELFLAVDVMSASPEWGKVSTEPRPRW